MESSKSCILPWIALVAVLATGIAPAGLRAEPPRILAEFKSVLGTTPQTQGWVHEGFCFGPPGEPSGGCPGVANNIKCWYQGSRDFNGDGFPDNTCLAAHGCKTEFEHYNSPDIHLVPDACWYTEWIAFDDGVGSNRPLWILDSTIDHSPPWGGPFFLNAPNHPVLRVVTGDGNNVSGTLPAVNPLNTHRNSGKAKIRKNLESTSASAVTLLINAAAGPRSKDHEFVEVRVFNYVFSFGVDGNPASPTYGKLTVVDADSGTMAGVLFDRPVIVAQPGTVGPHDGEFFLLRVILRNDGSYAAFLNETTDNYATGQVTATGTGNPEIQLTPDVSDATMWFDYVQVLEGEFAVTCPDPPVDHNRDGLVDHEDWAAFLLCSNGPGVPTMDSFECRCFDSDDDGDVDAADFALLQRCLTLNGLPDPDCDD